MAEQEQPKKGSTSKFKDALGKTDALIYNALGVNVESLLNALGIKSLADLKNLKFSLIKWGALLQILYALNPAQLKAMLSRFSLSSFNIASLLRILGVPNDVISLLTQIQTQFALGGGIFTGGTQKAGISGTFIPNSGWLPGYEDSLLDLNNPPVTGVTLDTPDDPNNPDYVSPGSENMLNVLAGVSSPEDVISATIPRGGIGTFYYENVDSPIRFESSKFFPFTDVSGFDIIRSYLAQQLGYIPSSGSYNIVTEEGRVDLVAVDTLGSTQYYWLLMMYNGITDVSQLKTGVELKIPDRDSLEELYFRAKSIGGDA